MLCALAQAADSMTPSKDIIRGMDIYSVIL